MKKTLKIITLFFFLFSIFITYTNNDDIPINDRPPVSCEVE